MIHVGNEGGNSAEKIHNPSYWVMLIFSVMIVTFITHRNYQRKHFIVNTLYLSFNKFELIKLIVKSKKIKLNYC